MIRKLLCAIGWHEFTWKLTSSGVSLNGNPPDYAKCKHCRITYGK